MFRNFATIILFYYVIKNKIELPIIIPIFFALGNFATLWDDKNSFLYFIAELTGTPVKIEYFTAFISSILLIIYLLSYANFNKQFYIYFYSFIIIIYILLLINQLYLFNNLSHQST
jgi:hypothetical protein